jgi:hypothetical protein
MILKNKSGINESKYIEVNDVSFLNHLSQQLGTNPPL